MAPPKRSGLAGMSLALAWGLIGVSGATLAGWWWWIDDLLQPFGAFAPLEASAAVGLGLIGAALATLESRGRVAAALASLGGTLGLIALAEHATGRDLLIDQLFARTRPIFATDTPGRMAPIVALSLVVGGIFVLWRVGARPRATQLAALAAAGSLLGAAGLSTLLGYGAELPFVYQWGGTLATPPVAGIALILLGLSLGLHAWRDDLGRHGHAPVWSAMPVVILCLTLTVILWLGLRGREQNLSAQHSQALLERLLHQAEDQLDKQAAQLERLARRWSDVSEPGPDQRPRDAAAFLRDAAGDLGGGFLLWFDASPKIVGAYPPARHATGPDAATEARYRAAFARATQGDGRAIAVLDASMPGPDGPEPAFLLVAPLSQRGVPAGFVTVEYSSRRFLSSITTARARIEDHYHVAVSVNGSPVFDRPATDARRLPRLGAERAQLIAGQRVRVSITPSPTSLARNRHLLPEFALGAGLGLTILLGLSVQLARRAQAGQRAAEQSNERLLAENEERRRVEDRLKVSDERLRLALDSTQIGIFEWNVASGHVYYSPGLWAMLGYELTQMTPTLEAWQALIHPDDVPLFRSRTESQLNGSTSFIEPEYRVRARAGDWRWVYTRSKSVATTADGRPTRIVGTVQDITARREAELALRASQAEARKLSLVAAKTDSPVLIAQADGRIEWANEAFCRVMEFSLAEVKGRHPVQFMDGPETSPRTITRIRAAMARGVGISTDVVNYSKSGRKYHLHLEIQPVRDDTGEIAHFIAVQTDVTARVESENQLRRAKAEADEASRAKSEFLASMSHEIRTPMNGVIGMTSLLMDTSLSEEQRDCVNTIRTSGQALLTIINDILDFSKIESGRMELERAPFELSLVLEEALDLFALQASAKHLELGYFISPGVPTWLVGDATRLRQVLVNLVNNAVKFTPSGSVSIEVHHHVPPAGTLTPFAPATDSRPTFLEFRIRDTGIGIPPDRIARLFKAFSQVDSSTTRKYGGTGLGLAISQRLCQLMGGDIRVESEPGRGTEFTFTIAAEIASARSDSGLSSTPEALRGAWVLCVEDHPVTQSRLRAIFDLWHVECAVAENATAAVALAARRTTPPALVVFDAGDSPDEPAAVDVLASIHCPRLALHPFGRTAPLPPSDGQPFATASKPIRTIPFILTVASLYQPARHGGLAGGPGGDRPLGAEIPLEVLVAEDNAVNQKVALRLLERLGYRADAVANGLEAVTTLENRRYDLVLMDLQMPEMDGFEAARQIRLRLPAARQPRIVALTANALPGDRERCTEAGMDDFVSKPVQIHEIVGAIRRLFGRSAPSERFRDS